jgi:hypothetical protein
MMQMLEKYEELLRTCQAKKASAIPPHALAQLDADRVKQLGDIQRFQAELDGPTRRAQQYLHQYSTTTLKRDLRMYNKWLAKLPSNLTVTAEEDQPFRYWRKFLEAFRDATTEELNERNDPAPLSPAEQQVAIIASQVQSYLDTVKLLEERCEQDIKQNPGEQAEIRRRYRKAIDALKDAT